MGYLSEAQSKIKAIGVKGQNLLLLDSTPPIAAVLSHLSTGFSKISVIAVYDEDLALPGGYGRRSKKET